MHRTKWAFSTVHVNFMASKCTVSMGKLSNSIEDYCYYLKMLTLMFIAANQTALTVFQH